MESGILETDSLLSNVEPILVSKKRGMGRNNRLTETEENPGLITRRSLGVLFAYIASTDGVLCTPLQLGAKLQLSRPAVLCHKGLKSWRKALQRINPILVLL